MPNSIKGRWSVRDGTDGGLLYGHIGYIGSDGSANLNREEKLRILAEVRKLPGADWYSYKDISRFYNAKYNQVVSEAQGDAGKRRKRRASEQRTTDDIRACPRSTLRHFAAHVELPPVWPSLTAQSIESLRVLVRDTPKPTPTHIAVWSSRLGANKEHVQAWLQLSTPQADNVSPTLTLWEAQMLTYSTFFQ